MGRARRIKLETREFAKAGDATGFFSAMLSRYPIGSRISEADARDLRALLKRHDEESEKVGAGIDHFEVATPPDGYSGKCFWIVRVDRSRIDFSFKHCLEPRPHD
ncbi:MAG: DCL family protein [Magnetospirillum sp.]|nr:DCL family protein [Magnetospirillum sp.]